MDLRNMRHRIILKHKVKKENEYGEVTYEYEAFYECYSKKMRLSNLTVIANNRDKLNETYRFIIRYRPGLNTDMRLEYDNEDYDVTHVNNIRELSKNETHIECVKRERDVRY